MSIDWKTLGLTFSLSPPSLYFHRLLDSRKWIFNTLLVPRRLAGCSGQALSSGPERTVDGENYLRGVLVDPLGHRNEFEQHCAESRTIAQRPFALIEPTDDQQPRCYKPMMVVGCERKVHHLCFSCGAIEQQRKSWSVQGRLSADWRRRKQPEEEEENSLVEEQKKTFFVDG